MTRDTASRFCVLSDDLVASLLELTTDDTVQSFGTALVEDFYESDWGNQFATDDLPPMLDLVQAVEMINKGHIL